MLANSQARDRRNRQRRHSVVARIIFYAFDLRVEGMDIRRQPLLIRRKRLRNVRGSAFLYLHPHGEMVDRRRLGDVLHHEEVGHEPLLHPLPHDAALNT